MNFTPERIKEARARCDAAAEGPWVPHTSPYHWKGPYEDTGIDGLDGMMFGQIDGSANRTFCCHSRTDLPDALDDIEALQAENDALRHEVGGDWHCDGCGEWVAATVASQGIECDLCPVCAAEAAEEKPAGEAILEIFGDGIDPGEEVGTAESKRVELLRKWLDSQDVFVHIDEVREQLDGAQDNTGKDSHEQTRHDDG